MQDHHHLASSSPITEPRPVAHYRALMREQAARRAEDLSCIGNVSRLSAEDIMEIRQLRNELKWPLRLVAADYGLSACYASQIANGHDPKNLRLVP